MLKSIKLSLLSLVVLMLLPVGLAAQTTGGFIYTNNDTTPNSISAYSFDGGGALLQIPYQASHPTFLTGGNGGGGGFYSSNRIITVGNFLYVSNSNNNTGYTSVSAFTIGGGGYLTPVPGSPFSTGAFNDVNNSGVSLAATPDGKYLFAGSTGTDLNFNVGSIAIFNIDPTTGALTPTSKSPVASGGPMSSMKVSPDGKYLVEALPKFNSGSGAIAVFAIHGPGNLHEVHNSPYVLSSSTGSASSVEFNCAGNLLYAGGNNSNIYVFNFSSGNLTPVTNSPFPTAAITNKAVVLNGNTLFASDPSSSSGTVNAFTVGTDTNGNLTLTLAGSANAASFDAVPGGLAVSNAGNFLFSADQNGDATGDVAGFTMFQLPTSSPIGASSLTTTVPASGFHSLAVYPPKTCTGTAVPALLNRR